MPLDEEIKSRQFVGLREFMKLNVIYFPTINKKVLQLILLFLIGMELQCERFIGVGGSRSTRGKPMCPSGQLRYPITYKHCRSRGSNYGHSSEKRAYCPLHSFDNQGVHKRHLIGIFYFKFYWYGELEMTRKLTSGILSKYDQSNVSN